MRSLFLRCLLILAAAATGCHKPIQVTARGCMETQVALVNNNNATPMAARFLPGYRGGEACKIVLLDVDGLLVNRNMSGVGSMGENPVAMFREKLDAAAADPGVRAVVLRINSAGGGVTACDVMRQDLIQFKQRKNVPIVACLMDLGAGGAYYLATAADKIMAHPTTVTGGMGVILNLYNLQETMAQFNAFGVPIKSGEFIDLGSPVKAMTPEAKALLQRISDEFLNRLRDTVVTARRLPPSTGENLFDGRVFTAQEALRRNLIDGIAYLDDAVAIARSMSGSDGAAVLVMYRRANDRAQSQYDVTPNIPLQNSIMPASVPGLDRSQLPTFLYLWQPEPLMEKTGGN